MERASEEGMSSASTSLRRLSAPPRAPRYPVPLPRPERCRARFSSGPRPLSIKSEGKIVCAPRCMAGGMPKAKAKAKAKNSLPRKSRATGRPPRRCPPTPPCGARAAPQCGPAGPGRGKGRRRVRGRRTTRRRRRPRQGGSGCHAWLRGAGWSGRPGRAGLAARPPAWVWLPGGWLLTARQDGRPWRPAWWRASKHGESKRKQQKKMAEWPGRSAARPPPHSLDGFCLISHAGLSPRAANRTASQKRARARALHCYLTRTARPRRED